MNYNIERENNIIKNIAKEIVLECAVGGFKVSEDLASYLVKLKLLDPKTGFTASEVMPRSMTQQLVTILVELLKRDVPAMNCIRLQVYWNSIKMNVGELKKEYFAILAEKSEPYINEILTLIQDDIFKVVKEMALCILVSYNLGNPTQINHIKETAAAFQSVFKGREMNDFFDMTDEQKVERIKILSKRVTGIRLYLKYLGKAGEGIEEVKDLSNKIEMYKADISTYIQTVSAKIENIREMITTLAPMRSHTMAIEGIPRQEIENLPPECSLDDLKHVKAILAIMLQHSFYLSDIASKLEEIDGDSYFFLKEYDEMLVKINTTIRGRDTIPTNEVFDDFEKLGEIWLEIQSYSYCFEKVREIAKKLEHINKKEYFAPTPLEKALALQPKGLDKGKKTSADSAKSTLPSSALLLKDSEDFHLEFNGFCAWTLYYNEGLLLSGSPESGIYQFEGQYYTFATKNGHDMWARDPQYCLSEIYEYLRHNPELIELLNAYENLYNAKFTYKVVKVEKKIAVRSEDAQTVLHPIEEYWDRDYTFSTWELKKRALALSRLVKCVTKSSQTTNPHSHFRASIGVLAAPDKDKEVQTKKDSSCCHPAIANYLYGLRGHKDDKFRVLELTRPVDETFISEIILKKGDPCRARRRKREPARWPPFPPPCSSNSHEKKPDNYEKEADYAQQQDTREG